MIVLFSLLSLAEALDCDFRPKHMPNGEWDNVPLNLRPLALTSSPDSFWALYQDGEVFSVDVDWYEISTNAFQMIPTEPLLPNTDYQLQSVEYSDVKFAYLRTGEQVDDTPPSMPSLLSVDRETSSSDWGDTDMMVFAFAEVDADVQFAFVELSADDTFRHRIKSGYQPMCMAIRSIWVSVKDSVIRPFRQAFWIPITRSKSHSMTGLAIVVSHC